MQAHVGAAAQLQVVAGGGVVVFTGVVNLGARCGAGDACFGHHGHDRRSRCAAIGSRPLVERLLQCLDALAVHGLATACRGCLAKGVE
ncbi:hypothetical protein D3C77_523950 [compost metagenome]